MCFIRFCDFNCQCYKVKLKITFAKQLCFMSFDDVLVGRPEAEEICPDEGKIPFPGGSGKQKQYCQQQGYIVTMLQASKLHRQQRLQDCKTTWTTRLSI